MMKIFLNLENIEVIQTKKYEVDLETKEAEWVNVIDNDPGTCQKLV